MRLLRRFLFVLWGIVVVGAGNGIGWAGTPTDQIRETTDKILKIVSDPALKGEAHAADRRRRIRAVVDERFDWEEMSRRTLARHWRKRTPAEKKEFIRLFGHLLERTYLDRVEGYSGEKVIYEGEAVDGDYGIVKVKIVTRKETEIPVKYRVKRKDGQWYVYDISIQGVSLINNYRRQFNSIIVGSSYKKLIKKLKAKVESGT
ncbi:MAG: ABC transporter substrate-binding protein [Deltaproteobacteria bacterium]|nr:ABC transporter substrate-binding protein [Deltaproteobacteria bacterium]MBW1948816.1 ABC transporter substrate-binding protein [Deltaproteobacteria bacterium]MBW2346285.1 ABC transporter substrate-binding protein [Deltaproteobacteria bacterium]